VSLSQKQSYLQLIQYTYEHDSASTFMLCLSIYINLLLKTNKISVVILVIFRSNRMVCYLQPEMLTLILKLKKKKCSVS
jgi:hypothetical protein